MSFLLINYAAFCAVFYSASIVGVLFIFAFIFLGLYFFYDFVGIFKTAGNSFNISYTIVISV